QLCGVRARDGIWTHPALALCARSGRRPSGSADAFLALPRPPARRDPVGGWHNSWRRLGELFLGTILGLGSERDMGPHRSALLHFDVARPARRLVDPIWFGRGECGLLSGGLDGVVCREFRDGVGIARL